MVKSMEKEFIITVLAENIRDNGFMIRNMDMELFSMLMVINIKGIGKMGKDQVKEFMNTRMAIFTRENGLPISRKAKAD